MRTSRTFSLILLLFSLPAGAQMPSRDWYQPIPIARVQAADDLYQRADQAASAHEFAKAAELYVQAFEAGFGLPEIAYQAASSYARAGDKEDAFAYLYKTVSMGYTAADQVRNDSDLVSLHDDPRWEDVLHLLQKNQHDSQEQAEKIWDNASLSTPFKIHLSDAERVAGLSKVWAEVKYNFVFPERLARLDWDRLYVSFIPKVLAARSSYEYYRVLAEFCAKLQDSHTNVYAPPELLGGLGLHTRLIGGRLIVLEAWDPELRAQGIRPGMEIVEIDGKPPAAYAASRVAPYQSASTPQDLQVRTFEYFLFWDAPGEPLRLTLQDATGPRMTRTLRRKPFKALGPLLPKPPGFSFRVLPGNIAYVALNSFEDNSVAEQFITNFDKIAPTNGLILDLRDNGGGNSGVGLAILATLIDKPVPIAFWQARDYKPIFRAWGRSIAMMSGSWGDLTPDAAHHYSKLVIVLTSPRTFSAAEDFLVAFDQSGRGSIVGEPTAGSTGQPLSFKLPGGGSGRVCTWRGVYPSGKEFLGIGIQPGILVAPTLEDLRAGKDAVLDAALAEISRAKGSAAR